MSDFKAKMYKIRFPLGLCPRPHCGSLQRAPNPVAVFKGAYTSKGREGVTLRYSGLAAVIDRTTHAWLLITWLFFLPFLRCDVVVLGCVVLICFVELSFIFVIYILLLKKSGCVVFLECSAPSCDIGCNYFPPGLQLPPQPLRGLLPILLLGEHRHSWCEQFA